MKEVVKQRLVGALILVALGVIFWPIIFVDPDTDIDIETLQMPPRPAPPEGFQAFPEEGDEATFDSRDDAALPEAEPAPGDALPAEDPAAAATDAGEPAASSERDADTADTPGEAAVPAPGETREAPIAEPQMDAQGLPVVWTLQLVTLSDGIKAEALRQDLIDDGHKAYVKAVTVAGKPLYRVHIGPKAERAQLEALQAELDARLGVKSMIRRYLP
jgi:DedD protein